MPWRRILLSAVIAVFILSGFFETKPVLDQTAVNRAETWYVSAADKSAAVSTDLEIIAHGGANNVFNEHTLTAYQIASDAHAGSLGIDLRMTNDNELIALHDADLGRTTTGNGIPEEFTLAEIKQLHTVAVFGEKTYKEAVPTLKEILETFGQKAHYYIETRLVDGKTKMEEPLVNLLQRYELLDPKYVSFKSFSKESLQEIQELAPEIRLTLLYEGDKFDLEDALGADVDVIGIESGNVTKEVVAELHQQGKEIHVFFNDDRTQLVEQQRVIMYGVDGVFTDDIDFTKQVITQ